MTEQQSDEYWRYYVNVCNGTECTKRGSQKIYDKLKDNLEDTPKAYVSTYFCFGACRIGPNLEISRQTRPAERQETLRYFFRVGGWKILGGTPLRDVMTRVKELISNPPPKKV